MAGVCDKFFVIFTYLIFRSVYYPKSCKDISIFYLSILPNKSSRTSELSRKRSPMLIAATRSEPSSIRLRRYSGFTLARFSLSLISSIIFLALCSRVSQRTTPKLPPPGVKSWVFFLWFHKNSARENLLPSL